MDSGNNLHLRVVYTPHAVFVKDQRSVVLFELVGENGNAIPCDEVSDIGSLYVQLRYFRKTSSAPVYNDVSDDDIVYEVESNNPKKDVHKLLWSTSLFSTSKALGGSTRNPLKFELVMTLRKDGVQLCTATTFPFIIINSKREENSSMAGRLGVYLDVRQLELHESPERAREVAGSDHNVEALRRLRKDNWVLNRSYNGFRNYLYDLHEFGMETYNTYTFDPMDLWYLHLRLHETPLDDLFPANGMYTLNGTPQPTEEPLINMRPSAVARRMFDKSRHSKSKRSRDSPTDAMASSSWESAPAGKRQRLEPNAALEHLRRSSVGSSASVPTRLSSYDEQTMYDSAKNLLGLSNTPVSVLPTSLSAAQAAAAMGYGSATGTSQQLMSPFVTRPYLSDIVDVTSHNDVMMANLSKLIVQHEQQQQQLQQQQAQAQAQAQAQQLNRRTSASSASSSHDNGTNNDNHSSNTHSRSHQSGMQAANTHSEESMADSVSSSSQSSHSSATRPMTGRTANGTDSRMNQQLSSEMPRNDKDAMNIDALPRISAEDVAQLAEQQRALLNLLKDHNRLAEVQAQARNQAAGQPADVGKHNPVSWTSAWNDHYLQMMSRNLPSLTSMISMELMRQQHEQSHMHAVGNHNGTLLKSKAASVDSGMELEGDSAGMHTPGSSETLHMYKNMGSTRSSNSSGSSNSPESGRGGELNRARLANFNRGLNGNDRGSSEEDEDDEEMEDEVRRAFKNGNRSNDDDDSRGDKSSEKSDTSGKVSPNNSASTNSTKGSSSDSNDSLESVRFRDFIASATEGADAVVSRDQLKKVLGLLHTHNINNPTTVSKRIHG